MKVFKTEYFIQSSGRLSWSVLLLTLVVLPLNAYKMQCTGAPLSCSLVGKSGSIVVPVDDKVGLIWQFAADKTRGIYTMGTLVFEDLIKKVNGKAETADGFEVTTCPECDDPKNCLKMFSELKAEYKRVVTHPANNYYVLCGEVTTKKEAEIQACLKGSMYPISRLENPDSTAPQTKIEFWTTQISGCDGVWYPSPDLENASLASQIPIFWIRSHVSATQSYYGCPSNVAKFQFGAFPDFDRLEFGKIAAGDEVKTVTAPKQDPAPEKFRSFWYKHPYLDDLDVCKDIVTFPVELYSDTTPGKEFSGPDDYWWKSGSPVYIDKNEWQKWFVFKARHTLWSLSEAEMKKQDKAVDEKIKKFWGQLLI